jgi:hypothetical protein
LLTSKLFAIVRSDGLDFSTSHQLADCFFGQVAGFAVNFFHSQQLGFSFNHRHNRALMTFAHHSVNFPIADSTFFSHHRQTLFDADLVG